MCHKFKMWRDVRWTWITSVDQFGASQLADTFTTLFSESPKCWTDLWPSKVVPQMEGKTKDLFRFHQSKWTRFIIQSTVPHRDQSFLTEHTGLQQLHRVSGQVRTESDVSFIWQEVEVKWRSWWDKTAQRHTEIHVWYAHTCSCWWLRSHCKITQRDSKSVSVRKQQRGSSPRSEAHNYNHTQKLCRSWRRPFMETWTGRRTSCWYLK